MIGSGGCHLHAAIVPWWKAAGKEPVESHDDCVSPWHAIPRSATEAEALQFVEVVGRQIFGVEVATEDDSGSLRVMRIEVGKRFIQLC